MREGSEGDSKLTQLVDETPADIESPLSPIPHPLPHLPFVLSPPPPLPKAVEALMRLEADLKFRSWAYGRQADPFCM